MNYMMRNLNKEGFFVQQRSKGFEVSSNLLLSQRQGYSPDRK